MPLAQTKSIIKPTNGRWPKAFLCGQLVNLQSKLDEYEKITKQLGISSNEPITEKDPVDCASDRGSRHINTSISNRFIKEIGETRQAIELIADDLKSVREKHNYGRCQSDDHRQADEFINSRRLIIEPATEFCNKCQEEQERKKGER